MSTSSAKEIDLAVDGSKMVRLLRENVEAIAMRNDGACGLDVHRHSENGFVGTAENLQDICFVSVLQVHSGGIALRTDDAMWPCLPAFTIYSCIPNKRKCSFEIH